MQRLIGEAESQSEYLAEEFLRSGAFSVFIQNLWLLFRNLIELPYFGPTLFKLSVFGFLVHVYSYVYKR